MKTNRGSNLECIQVKNNKWKKGGNKMRNILSILLPLLLVTGVLLADTYNEEPNADTWVWEGNGPYGSITQLRTNIMPIIDQEIVISFDLSSIPSGSVVNSANLYIYRYGGSDTLTCELFRVTEYWDELTLVDSIAHDICYPIDQITIIDNGWYSFDILPLVQDWMDGTYDNYGIVFYGTSGPGSYQYFRSREYTVQTLRPYLEMDYTPAVALERTTFGAIKALFAQ
jgi:hypothetical protein